MPRLKLPPPAKRKELMVAAANRANRNNVGRYGCVKIGYAMALRHVHKIRNREERARRSRSWRYADLYRGQINALKAEIATLKEQLAKANAPDMTVSAGGTD